MTFEERVVVHRVDAGNCPKSIFVGIFVDQKPRASFGPAVQTVPARPVCFFIIGNEVLTSNMANKSVDDVLLSSDSYLVPQK